MTDYQKINMLIGKVDTMPVWKFLLQIIPRISSFWYFVFDTLFVLTKIKVINSLDLKWIIHKWAAFW